MPSDRKPHILYQPGRLYMISLNATSTMYCLPGSIERDIVIPAHPRYTRMYGVTNSIAFQALLHFRKLNFLIVNWNELQLSKRWKPTWGTYTNDRAFCTATQPRRTWSPLLWYGSKGLYKIAWTRRILRMAASCLNHCLELHDLRSLMSLANNYH